MDQATHNRVVSFIRGIADEVLRDLFRRGKHAESFTRHFCKPRPLRPQEEVSAGILAVEKAAEGRLAGLLVGAHA